MRDAFVKQVRHEVFRFELLVGQAIIQYMSVQHGKGQDGKVSRCNVGVTSSEELSQKNCANASSLASDEKHSMSSVRVM